MNYRPEIWRSDGYSDEHVKVYRAKESRLATTSRMLLEKFWDDTASYNGDSVRSINSFASHHQFVKQRSEQMYSAYTP